jgi:hypothetical protein
MRTIQRAGHRSAIDINQALITQIERRFGVGIMVYRLTASSKYTRVLRHLSEL